MTGDNPYAPPQAAELESRTVFSHNNWKIYSGTLIVRFGATLPEVDLENGARETPLHPVRLSPPRLFAAFRIGNPNTAYSFVSRRTRFARISRTAREVLFNVSLLAFAISGTYPDSINLILALFAVLAIWSFLDKPKLKIEISAKSGWLRITGIHPDALDYLRGIAKPISTR